MPFASVIDTRWPVLIALVTAELTIVTPYECSSATASVRKRLGAVASRVGKPWNSSTVALRCVLVVDHGGPVPGPGEHECCCEPGRAAADDDHIAGDGFCGAVHDGETSVGVAASTLARSGQ